MPFRINVELKDGAVCKMAKNSFSLFLSLEKVAKFKRSDGWVVVGEDQLRDLKKDNDYPPYAERRSGV